MIMFYSLISNKSSKINKIELINNSKIFNCSAFLVKQRFKRKNPYFYRNSVFQPAGD